MQIFRFLYYVVLMPSVASLGIKTILKIAMCIVFRTLQIAIK